MIFLVEEIAKASDEQLEKLMDSCLAYHLYDCFIVPNDEKNDDD